MNENTETRKLDYTKKRKCLIEKCMDCVKSTHFTTYEWCENSCKVGRDFKDLENMYSDVTDHQTWHNDQQKIQADI